MTERLADIGARVEGVRQLGAVVNAMRGIAAAPVQPGPGPTRRGRWIRGDDRGRHRARAGAVSRRCSGWNAARRASGARVILRRTGVRRCLQRTRARLRRRRSFDRETIPHRHERCRGGGRARPCRRLANRHAGAHIGYSPSGGPHRRRVVREHRRRRNRPARCDLQPMASRRWLPGAARAPAPRRSGAVPVKPRMTRR